MRSALARVTAALAALGAAACSGDPALLAAKGHHVVTVDTDAVVPPDPAADPDPNARVPLFDRLEIAILAEGESAPAPEAARDFAVDATTFRGGGASFTVEPPEGARVRVRARLFRDAVAFGGEPRPEATIEVVAGLPPTPAEGAVETTIELRTEDVGVPRGSLAAPVEVGADAAGRVRAGAVSASKVGTWPGADLVPCASAPKAGEACVRGGAYWMGNPLVKGDDFVESDRQRLVVLSPYFLDTREVRVGELRAFLATQPPSVDTVTRHADDPASEHYFCTYTDAVGDGTEEAPANCVPWAVADAYCASKGGSLPSEAEFEYASGELRSALFVWGTDEAPLCEAAVWGRSGLPGSYVASIGSSACRELGAGAQALPDDPSLRGATRLTDRITIGGVEVFDLAGNLQEWVADRFNGQDEACWSKADRNVFVDPVCDLPGALDARSVRGGSWVQSREFLRAAYRASRGPNQGEAYVVGFRCARPGHPGGG